MFVENLTRTVENLHWTLGLLFHKGSYVFIEVCLCLICVYLCNVNYFRESVLQ